MQELPVKQNILTNPWTQLVFGVICMAMVANLQYGWPAFVNPINDKFSWGPAAIKVSFTIFIVLETWLVPVEGWLVDRFSTRPVVISGGILCLLSWVINAYANSLLWLYLAAAVGGIGVGCVYGAVVGRTVRWFPQNRGLALGIVTASFGVATAITVAPIGNLINTQGYEFVFLWVGIAQGLIVIGLGFIMTAPPQSLVDIKSSVPGATSYSARPMEVLREPAFWIMYGMFVLMVGGGLIAVAQLGPIAKEYGVGLPMMALILSFDRILNNGISRPLFGWISDRVGRENTMFAAFGIEALAIVLLALLGRDPVAYVILGSLVIFSWGAAYSLFPATAGDSFGTKFAATNTGMLYTAKGTAAILVPLGATVTAATGNWSATFYMAAAMCALAAGLALWVLKPMRLELCARYDELHASKKN